MKNRIEKIGPSLQLEHNINSEFASALQGAVRLFALGYGLQVCLHILMQARRAVRKPSLLPKLLIHRKAFQLGAFLGGFSAVFKVPIVLLMTLTWTPCCVWSVHVRGTID